MGFLFGRRRWLIRPALQSLELLHFMLCGFGLSLFPIETRQSEMRLRRERAFFLDGEKPGPGFFSSGGVAFQ